MDFTRVYAVFLRQIYLFRGNPTRLASLFIWLLIDVTLWGFISRYLGTVGHSGFDFVTTFLGAIILWGFVTRVQQGIMTSFLEDVWTQNFINFFASPLRIVEYLSGLVITSIVAGLLGLLVVVCIAGVAFGFNVLRMGLYLLPFLGILFIFAAAMGTFVSGVIFRLGPAAEWLGWPVPLVLSVFAGVFYPINTLPLPFQFVAKLIPASWVFESVRAVLTNSASAAQLGVNLLIGLGLALVYLAAAYAFFARIYRRNLETGAIARFSAESW